MQNRLILAVLPLVVLTGGWLQAHHNFSAIFDMNQRVTVTGTLTKLDWRNPHIEISMNVKGEGGKAEVWLIESMPPSFFRARNVTKADFERAMGQTIAVEAMRARDGSPSGLMQKITFPDGNIVSWQ